MPPGILACIFQNGIESRNDLSAFWYKRVPTRVAQSSSLGMVVGLRGATRLLAINKQTNTFLILLTLLTYEKAPSARSEASAKT